MTLLKIIYVLLDGVGDLPDPSLNYVTPLHAARTPTLDHLTRNGALGTVIPVQGGFPPESDVAVFSMLGYDFGAEYVGRGVVEGVGAGVQFEEGDLALRVNFATVDSRRRVIDRRVGRTLATEEALDLVKDIATELVLDEKGATFTLTPTEAHRGVLVLRVEDGSLSSNVTNTDPAVTKLGGYGVYHKLVPGMTIQRCKPLDETPQAIHASKLVNEFSERVSEVLTKSPLNARRKELGMPVANALLLRDAGHKLPEVESITEKYGLRFASLVDLPVEKGIAKLTGMERFQEGGLSDFEIKAKKSIQLLEDYDGVYVHIKGPDEAGHDGDAKGKTRVIEDIDTRFFKTLSDGIDLHQVSVVVSADHSTPCQLESHSSDPVPLLITGSKVPTDDSCRFTEKEGITGSLGTLFGPRVLEKVLSFR